MAIVNTLKVVGTTFNCRQNRIAALEDDAPVYFIPEPNNKYDPKAISVRTESGDVLGYIGRDDPNRDRIRSALSEGFVIARARKVGGFRKYDGGTASLGLRVQWYFCDALYGYAQYMGKEEVDAPSPTQRKNTPQQPKQYVGCKYKGKEILRKLDLRNIEKDSPERMKRANRHRRAEFKRGNDIKSSHLGWRYSAYITEEEAITLYKERKVS